MEAPAIRSNSEILGPRIVPRRSTDRSPRVSLLPLLLDIPPPPPHLLPFFTPFYPSGERILSSFFYFLVTDGTGDPGPPVSPPRA